MFSEDTIGTIRRSNRLFFYTSGEIKSQDNNAILSLSLIESFFIVPILYLPVILDISSEYDILYIGED